MCALLGGMLRGHLLACCPPRACGALLSVLPSGGRAVSAGAAGGSSTVSVPSRLPLPVGGVRATSVGLLKGVCLGRTADVPTDTETDMWSDATPLHAVCYRIHFQNSVVKSQ